MKITTRISQKICINYLFLDDKNIKQFLCATLFLFLNINTIIANYQRMRTRVFLQGCQRKFWQISYIITSLHMFSYAIFMDPYQKCAGFLLLTEIPPQYLYDWQPCRNFCFSIRIYNFYNFLKFSAIRKRRYLDLASGHLSHEWLRHSQGPREGL